MATPVQTKTSKPGPQGHSKPVNQNTEKFHKLMFAYGRGRQHIHKPNRDPILEIVTHAIQESGLTNKKIAQLAGISAQTISRWQNYELTRRPQFFTVNAVMQALGYKLTFTKNH